MTEKTGHIGYKARLKNVIFINLVLFIIIITVIGALGFNMLTSLRSTQENLNEALDEKQTLETDLNGIRQQKEDLEATIKDLKNENTRLESINEALMQDIENAKLGSINEELIQEIEDIKRIHKMEILYGLVDLESMDSSIIVELRYATENNFTDKQLYPSNSKALLRRETALKLLKANDIFRKDGYAIKIWDAYRPLHVQKILWEHSPNSGFIADPKRGSKHNRGSAIDITLVDKSGKEIEMPTEFDDFTEKAVRDYPYCSETAKSNMEYMTKVMEESGFVGIKNEWWHFDDVDWGQYPLLDIGFDVFQ